MELNYEREAEKRAELSRRISQALREVGTPESQVKGLSGALLETCISTSPPEAASNRLELVVMGRMGAGGGRSTKAGNVSLNLGKLFEALVTGVLTGVGAVQVPLTVPLAALVIWNSLWRCAQVNISETEAAVLYTMWVHRDADCNVSNSGLLERCNSLLEKYGRPPLSAHMLRDALKTLEKIGTIEQARENPGMWWLREWTRVSYR